MTQAPSVVFRQEEIFAVSSDAGVQDCFSGELIESWAVDEEEASNTGEVRC